MNMVMISSEIGPNGLKFVLGGCFFLCTILFLSKAIKFTQTVDIINLQ